MSVRTFPIPDSMWRGVVGTCKWCGLAVARPAIYWHPPCAHEYNLHTRLETQYQFLAERDGEHCGQCGARPERWRANPVYCVTRQNCFGNADWTLVYWDRPAGRWQDLTPDERQTGAHQEIERVTALEVDHRVPLWSVANLPDHERRWYFGPENLWLLCPKDHKAKTAREAAERAQARRIAA